MYSLKLCHEFSKLCGKNDFTQVSNYLVRYRFENNFVGLIKIIL